MFEAAGRTLAEGGAILIFPEGKSQPEPVLQPLRSGAARLLLGAEAAEGRALDSTVVPVGLLFNEPGTFRSGWAHVLVGESLRLGETRARYAAEPEATVRDLTERMEDALGALIVEAGDRETQRLLHVAESIWRAEGAVPAVDAEASAEWRRRAVRAYRWLRTREPERIVALRREMLPLRGAARAKRARRAGARRTVLARDRAPLGASRDVPPDPRPAAGALGAGGPCRRPTASTAGWSGWRILMATRRPRTSWSWGWCSFPLCWIAEGWLAWRLGRVAAARLLSDRPGSLGTVRAGVEGPARARRARDSRARALAHPARPSPLPRRAAPRPRRRVRGPRAPRARSPCSTAREEDRKHHI